MMARTGLRWRMSDTGAPPTRPPASRDPRLDVFRGLALVMIFINHVPGNIWEHYTSRNFGFSDAAEGFVLMSGISAGLAYVLYFRAPMRFWDGLAKVWHRVWTLYLVHILVTVLALGIAAAFGLWFNAPGLLYINRVDVFFNNPMGFLVGVPILTHQFGYANILPLYLVILFFAPFALMLAWVRPMLLLALSALMWLIAAQFRINLPNFPNPGGWFLNPLSWQFLFMCGLLTGTALKDGRRFVPVRLWLQIISGGFLLLSLVWVKWPAFGSLMGTGMWQMQDAGVPVWITSFNKNYLHLPRLLHILALAYFLSSFDSVRWACGTAIAAPFALLGRQALLVFATGSVICFGLQGVKLITGEQWLLDTVMLATGLAVLFGIAAVRQYWPKSRARP